MMIHQAPQPRDVTAALLDDARLHRACAERDVGALFRLLNTRGVRTRRIAADAGITQGRVYDYMTGKSRAEKFALFEQIADAFHIPGHLLGLARRSWEPQPAPVVVGHPAPMGDDLMAINAFRDADRQTGGSRLYQAVIQHLEVRVAPRLVSTHGGAEVFAAAAALSEMAGWMAHDSAQDSLALKHLTRALPLAQASGDTLLAANITASASHLALQGGDAAAAAHWAQAGLVQRGTGPRLPALTARLYTMRARAFAALKQSTAAEEALDAARHHLMATPSGEHPWLSPFDTAAFASEAALALRDLNRYDAALENAEQAVALRETGRARSLMLSRITLVDIHVRRRELDAALAVGEHLLETSPSLGSVRVVHQLDALCQELALHRTHSPVREYLQRFDEAARTRRLLLADIITPHKRDTAG